MKKMFVNGVMLVLLLNALPAAAEQVHVSAAASLTEAVKAIMEVYHRQHPGSEVLLNVAASGALAKQIAAGAPADIYISANPQWMDHLRQQGLIAEDSLLILLGNRLVFFGLPGPIRTLQDLADLSLIALPSPRSSPAGRYAEQALQAAGLLESLTAQEQLVPVRDVRQALLHAERGEVAGAFIYRTDALLARQAVVLFEVPPELYPPILYPAALTVAGAARPAARNLFAFLAGPEAQRIFQDYGFLIPTAE